MEDTEQKKKLPFVNPKQGLTYSPRELILLSPFFWKVDFRLGKEVQSTVESGVLVISAA